MQPVYIIERLLLSLSQTKTGSKIDSGLSNGRSSSAPVVQMIEPELAPLAAGHCRAAPQLTTTLIGGGGICRQRVFTRKRRPSEVTS
jgi:hypothetical protein